MTETFVAWVVAAAVISGVASWLGDAVVGRGRYGILIDERDRFSLSRFQIVLWTVLVLSLIAAVVYGRMRNGESLPMAFTIPDELLTVLGISAGSAVVAGAVKNSKDRSAPDRIAASRAGSATLEDGRPDPHRARFSQVFLVEEGAQADKLIDIAKFQSFWFTLILVASYVVTVVQALRDAGSPSEVKALPGFAGTFATLLAISHGAYIVGKVPDKDGTPDGPTVADLRLEAEARRANPTP